MLVFKLDLIGTSQFEHDGYTETEQLLCFNNAVYILSRSISKKNEEKSISYSALTDTEALKWKKRHLSHIDE